jgi:hypothetical protein
MHDRLGDAEPLLHAERIFFYFVFYPVPQARDLDNFVQAFFRDTVAHSFILPQVLQPR